MTEYTTVGHNKTNQPSEGVRKEEENGNYLIADCSGCGECGEYWLRVYRDQHYYRLHLLPPARPAAGTTIGTTTRPATAGSATRPTTGTGSAMPGKLCGNYSENIRCVIYYSLLFHLSLTHSLTLYSLTPLPHSTHSPRTHSLTR